MRISDCSSDVCSSDLELFEPGLGVAGDDVVHAEQVAGLEVVRVGGDGRFERLRWRGAFEHGGEAQPRPRADRAVVGGEVGGQGRSEEHTSEIKSLMRNSYAVLCLKTKKKRTS